MKKHLFFMVFFVLVLAAYAPGARLSIDTDKTRLTADRAASVVVTAAVKDDAGRPLPGKPVYFTASRGKFSTVKDLGDGRYRATLEVPSQGAPHRPDHLLILVSALLDTEAPAAGKAIPVYSNLSLQGKAAPGLTMSASAGGRRLGPEITTGSDGSFKLTAPVPPGVSRVTITARKGDKEKTDTVNVDTGGITRHVVQAVPEKVAAGGAPGYINIFAVEFSGRAESRNDFKLNPGAAGEVTTLANLGGGIFQTQFSLKDASADRADVTVRYAGATRIAVFEPAAPGLAKLTLRADRTEVFSGDSITLSITAIDFTDRPASGAIISVSANGEPAGQAADMGAGLYQFNYVAQTTAREPDIVFHAQGYVTEFADKTARSGDVLVRILEPDITLSAESETPRLNAGETARVRVHAESRTDGSGVEGLTLRATADAGSAGSVQDDGGGYYSFDFTAPDRFEGRSLSLEIHAPDTPGSPMARAAFEWVGPGAPFGEAGQMVLAASASTVDAGGNVTLTAALKDNAGRGVPGREVTFSADTGLVGSVTDAGDGTYSALLTVPDVAAAGVFAIRAACACGGANLSAEASLTVPPNPPANLSLSSDNSTVYLSGPADATVNIAITDRQGNGVGPHDVALTVTQNGQSESFSATTDANGTAGAEITLSPPSGSAQIAAVISGSPSVNGSLTLEKIKYKVSRIELTALPDTIAANGASTLDIEVYAVDEAGADAQSERMDFNLLDGSGRLNQTYCTTDSNGRCTVQYTSGLACGGISVESFAYTQDTVRQTVSAEETPAVTAYLELNNTVPHDLVANGTDAWTLQALARDAGACPVAGDVLDLSVTTGSGSVASTAATNANGVASARYTAGYEPGDVTIRARSRIAPMVLLSTDLELLPWQPSAYDVVPDSATQTAGAAFTVTITARDYFGNVMTTWDTSDLTYALSGPGAAPDGTVPALPAASAILSSFNNGVAVLTVTAYRAETLKLSLTDGKVTGQSADITVNGGPAIAFDVSAGANQTAGAAFTLTATARDVYGNAAAYNASGKNFSFSGATASPDGNAPLYPPSATVRAAFSNGTAQVPITLYNAETVTLTFSDASLSATTGNITVSRAAMDKIAVVQYNNQTQIITNALPQNPVVKVSDAYGNPIPAAPVTFAVTGGGGAATGLNKTTDANGRTGPDSWTMGPAPGANTLSASIASGTTPSATITATAYVPSPNANITLQSPVNYICPADSIDLTGTSSVASAVSSLTGYLWDFDGAAGSPSTTDADPAAVQYNATNTVSVSLTVTDNFSQTNTETYTIHVSNIPGPLSLSASPASITANGVTTSAVTSAKIYGCAFATADDGIPFTVGASLGTITTGDAHGAPGLQVLTSGGVITFTVQSGTDVGTAEIISQSTEFGTALNARTTVTMTGPDTTRPTVVSFSPSGNVSGTVTAVTVVFSEDVVITADSFKIKMDGHDVDGTWNYTSGNFTATFTPEHPLDVEHEIVEVTVKSNIVDLAGNQLDGEQSGSPSSFEFTFGEDISCTPPTAPVCNAAPGTFSMDTTTAPPHESTISFTLNDNYYINFWRVDIKSGASTIRSYLEYNSACSCHNVCTANTIPCTTCCAGDPCCQTVNDSVDWDGRNAQGVAVDDGAYTYDVTAYDLSSCSNAAPCSGTVTVDNPIDFGSFGP